MDPETHRHRGTVTHRHTGTEAQSERAEYRDTSLMRDSAPLGPYSRNMPRALWWSYGVGLFLMSEVSLYSARSLCASVPLCLCVTVPLCLCICVSLGPCAPVYLSVCVCVCVCVCVSVSFQTLSFSRSLSFSLPLACCHSLPPCPMRPFPAFPPFRGISPLRKGTAPGPYRRPMPRVLGGS